MRKGLGSARVIVLLAFFAVLLAGCNFNYGASSDPAANSSSSSSGGAPLAATGTDNNGHPFARFTPAPQPSAPAGVAEPNTTLTPGAVRTDATAASLCANGHSSGTKQYRLVNPDQYVQVYGEYHVHYPQAPGTYELDHLVPLEIGGSNDNSNLWPQPAAGTLGFHQKDDLENKLTELVCTNQLDLLVAQHAIASDWYAAYQKYVKGA